MVAKSTHKKALITGITGQDGSYMAELLLNKDYEVSGIMRTSTNFMHDNIKHIQDRLNLIQGDLLDQTSLIDALKATNPDEVYNFASQTVPAESFKQPILTGEITALGAHRMLDAVREICPKAKFFQASSSGIFGWSKEVPQNEKTPYNPAD